MVRVKPQEKLVLSQTFDLLPSKGVCRYMQHYNDFSSGTKLSISKWTQLLKPVGIFQNQGVCGQVFPLSPHHPLLCQVFALAPIFWRQNVENLFVREHSLHRLHQTYAGLKVTVTLTITIHRHCHSHHQPSPLPVTITINCHHHRHHLSLHRYHQNMRIPNPFTYLNLSK